MCGQANTDDHDENVRVIPNKCGTDVDEIDEKRSPNRNTTDVWNVDLNEINDCILLQSARHNVMKLWSIAQRMLNWKERSVAILLDYIWSIWVSKRYQMQLKRRLIQSNEFEAYNYACLFDYTKSIN